MYCIDEENYPPCFEYFLYADSQVKFTKLMKDYVDEEDYPHYQEYYGTCIQTLR
jgi:hypothetical protein